ncbi:MAG: SLBB domain-containing protein [Gemmatimonadota bacterium]
MRDHSVARNVRRSLFVAASLLPGSVAVAQLPTTKPTAAQAQTLLQTRPDLVAQLRQRFATAGMTKEQVHARLRAEGYPEDMLDAYLPGITGNAAEPTDDVFRAVRALGIADAEEIAVLQGANAGQGVRSSGDARAGVAAVSDTLRSARSATDSAAIVRSANDSGFTVFGLDIFRGSTTQFDPNVNGPIDDNYRLGPGDKLVLILTGDVEASYSLDVTREGFVVIPSVGEVHVASLTLGQLRALLASRLSRVYSGIRANNQGTTRFSINVARLRSNQVYVLGDVLRPASYVVSSAGTALTALYAAGGPTINGSLRRVEIRRAGSSAGTVDLYDYILRGDASHDLRLETGDVVFVPVHGARVRIVGEIARPATYELLPGETLTDVVRNAGGFRVTAARQRVLVDRIMPPGERRAPGFDRVTIDVASEAGLAAAGFALQDGDVVHVLAIADRVRNRISITGNVYQPGAQGYTPGMRLSDALRKAGGLQPDTYLGQVLISRLRSDSTRAQLRATLADTTGRVIDDPALQEDDQVTVFSLTSFRPERYVSIGGAIRNGNRFPYREGMTLRDLILLAGGVQESAYLKEAEIARLPASRDSGRTATTIRVALDSTYLPERKPNGDYRGAPGLPTSASGAPEVILQPYDNVLILRQPSWELQRTVLLQGEVRFPGAYSLETKSERLSDLIARAGGLTDEAYADGIVFLRAQGGVGRVGVDLSAALRSRESSDNLILRDGDNITVPAFNSVVTIRGAVNQPSTVAYVRGMGIDYYIGAAGGAAKNGDDGRAYVAQPSGKLESVRRHFLRPTSMPRPKPGSVVTVPELDPSDKKDFVALAGSVAQIIAGTVAIIVALRR